MLCREAEIITYAAAAALPWSLLRYGGR
jgi:hypothetical protein